MWNVFHVLMEKPMQEETKAILNELIIELNEQARSIHDPERSLEIRRVADEISDLIKQERQGA